MGILHKPDGRWLVGLGVENGNEYAGSMGYRDIVIQLTASGATDNSMEYLAFLLDYAVSHYAVGEPIVPPNVSVYISTNGYVKAVQADDYSTDGTNFEVGGIKWNGSAWDFSNAGQGGSGGGGSGVLVVSADMTADTPVLNKTWQEIHDAALTSVVVLVSLTGDAVEQMALMRVSAIDTNYLVAFVYPDTSNVPVLFTGNTADGYPVYVENP